MALNRKITLALLGFFLLASCSQLALTGYPWSELSRDPLLILISQYISVLAGDGFPSGWLPDFNQGAGSPYGVFDASIILPLTAAAAAFMTPLGALKVSAFLLLLTGTAGMYQLGKQLYDTEGAFLSAVLFFYLPPRIAQLTVFGDFSAFAAGAIYPWSVLAYLRYVQKPGRFTSLFLATTACLSAAMDLTALSALAIIPFLGRAFTSLSTPLKNHILASLFILLGAAVAAGIWLPPLLSAVHIQLAQPEAAGFSPETHGIYPSQLFSFNWGAGISRPGPSDDAPFQLGILHIALFLLASAGFYRRTGADRRVRFIFAIWITFFLILISPAASPLWKSFLFLKLLRYPWRLLWIPATLVSILGGGLYFGTTSSKETPSSSSFRLPTIFFIAAIVFQLNGGFYTHAGWGEPDMKRYSHTAIRSLKNAPYWLAPFQPVWATHLHHRPFRLTILEGDGTVTRYHKDQAQHLVFDCTCRKTSRFATNILYFPGWRLTIDGHSAPIERDPLTSEINFIVPEGRHHVSLTFHRFSGTSRWRHGPWIGMILSASCIIFLPPHRKNHGGTS